VVTDCSSTKIAGVEGSPMNERHIQTVRSPNFSRDSTLMLKNMVETLIAMNLKKIQEGREIGANRITI
jgi:hypothetical protein